jgi:MYXO-CTERM domain-containing protein
LAGTTLVDSISGSGNTGVGPGSISYSYTAQVLREAGGTLDFTYLVSNTGTADQDAINRATVTNFAGWTTSDGDYDGGPSGVAPSHVDRNLNGATVGFDFKDVNQLGILVPGSNSRVFYVKTNALDYAHGKLNIIDGGVTTLDAFAPAPEPASAVLPGTGFLALAGICAWRRRKASAVQA